MKKYLIHITFMLLLITPDLHAQNISFLIIDADSYLVNKAMKGLTLPDGIEARFFIHSDITDDPRARAFIEKSEVVIVDVMMPELSEYLIEHTDMSKKKIYAVRGSRNNEMLKKKGFVFDPLLREYFKNHTVENMQNLILRAAHMEFDSTITYDGVAKLPLLRLYHTGTDQVFTTYEDYLAWYKSSPFHAENAPWIGMIFFSSSLMEGQMGKVDYLVDRLEAEGFNVLPAFGKDLEILKQLFTDKHGKARIDLILAFSMKFYSSLSGKVESVINNLNVPIFNAIHLYANTIEEWQKDPVGIPPLEIGWNIANAEISGMIEPTPLSGKVPYVDEESGRQFFLHLPIKENIELMIPRLWKWIHLRQKANAEKRVAILYYNHSQGKQNIGASYLNVFKSLEGILRRMKHEGYQFETDGRITEAGIKEMILKYGRNIGSWAPGELEKMLALEKGIRLPIATYQKWFEKLPEDFKTQVIQQWGRPESSDIMVRDGDIIIPAIVLGNVVILPEPSRGWGDDPMKLYHDPMLWPHHQYIAAYLWLRHGFEADAMIHLGTHATHEWLPGKQAGLSHSCPPEVLITDIPNLYPYIVDDVGEGIQAKRRGRGVIIDHLTPPLRESDLYHEYAELYNLISSYNRSLSMGSKTSDAKLEKIREMAVSLGLDTDLDIKTFDDESIEKIEHYLLEVKSNFMPYGMHTFGKSFEKDAIDEMTACIAKRNDDIDTDAIRQGLADSGPREMDHLIKGLNGGYIPSGEGNDPLRNPAAIPTGKNFFGFNPHKIPSKIAWELGKAAAEDIIAKHLEEKKKYPEQVAVVVWATEAIRNEGINESTILWLIGVRPVWGKSGRVKGTEVVPGRELGRPRIDVLINPSGLYRDLFPNMLLFLDEAVQKAAVQEDVENLIRKHSQDIRSRLMASGMDEKAADTFSRLRIFTEKPGVYGTGVSEMTSASGIWESDDEIVRVYENRVGFAFGLGKWGVPAQDVFKENLKNVSTAIHSISSNVYGTMDNDDMFQYLGGLSLAVKKERGEAPDTLISLQRDPEQAKVEGLAKTIGRELRSRYLNPKWIEGMKKEKYAGAREMAKFVEYMWGWQVTVPTAVDKARWDQTYAVYVEDKYGLDVKEFFNKENPWAYQSIAAHMLEAIRKDYWQAEEKVRQKLALEYAMNVVEKGVACCEHTCNHPMLNQMVMSIISLPGLMSPEMVEKFRLAIEQATGKSLAEQAQARKSLQKKLNEGFRKKPENRQQKSDAEKTVNKEVAAPGEKSKQVSGYKMEEITPQDETTEMSSSGVQWFASVFVLLIIGLFAIGMRLNKRK